MSEGGKLCAGLDSIPDAEAIIEHFGQAEEEDFTLEPIIPLPKHFNSKRVVPTQFRLFDVDIPPEITQDNIYTILTYVIIVLLGMVILKQVFKSSSRIKFHDMFEDIPNQILID